MGLVTITLMESGAIIHHAYFHIGIEEQLSDALEPGHHYRYLNGIRVLVTNTSLMEPVEL
jgi:hypothetical protein